MMTRLWLVAVLVAALVRSAAVGGPPKATATRAPNDRAAVERPALPFVKNKPWLGLAVGVTRAEGRQFYGYGQVVLNGKKQTPAANTVFEIGSVTKTFTATILADLVRTGVVRLDDPAQLYLPAGLKLPQRDGRHITLLHLATHTSSLPRDLPALGLLALAAKEFDNPFAAAKTSNLEKGLALLRLARPIGCKLEYSNLGVGLLGTALVGAAHASSYDALLKARVTDPLGMADTAIALHAEQRQRFPPCHRSDGKPTKAWTFANLEGCGALHSTVHDLLIYVDAYLGRHKTPLADALALAIQPWRDRNHASRYIGLCWMRETIGTEEYTFLWHNGGTYGSRSFLGFVPEKKLGVVVLSNSADSVDDIGIKLLEKLVADKD